VEGEFDEWPGDGGGGVDALVMYRYMPSKEKSYPNNCWRKKKQQQNTLTQLTDPSQVDETIFK
jgi:hypothetical protein